MPKFRSIPRWLPGLFLAGALALWMAAAAGRPGPVSNMKPPSQEGLQAYVQRILDLCRDRTNPLPCYDDEIPKLMGEISMEDAFRVTALVQQQDDRYWYCHVLSHKLVALEVQKDPENWKSILPRCPDDMCSNGCFHGAFQERFKRESLAPAEFQSFLPELKTVCDPPAGQELTPHNFTSCHHGLGHLMMYLTDADIRRAAQGCEYVGLKDDRRSYVQTCTEGLFMQLYQPREEEDFALVRGKVPSVEEAPAFCDRFEGMTRTACHRESWVLYGDEIRNAPGIMKFCFWAADEPAEHHQCLNKMFFSLLTVMNFDVDGMLRVCAEIPAPHRGQCFRDTAARLITADKTLVPRAVAVCQEADRKGLDGGQCWEALAGYANHIFMPQSPEAAAMCRMLPEEWIFRCLDPGYRPASYIPAAHDAN